MADRFKSENPNLQHVSVDSWHDGQNMQMSNQTRPLKDNPHQSSAVNTNRITMWMRKNQWKSKLCSDFLEFIFTKVWVFYSTSVEQMDFC